LVPQVQSAPVVVVQVSVPVHVAFARQVPPAAPPPPLVPPPPPLQV